MMFLKIPALQFKDLQRGQGRLPEPEVFKLDFSFQWEHPLFPPQHAHAVQMAALHAGVLIGKSSAPSCQIVKWSMNNKSPPELCPCSAVAGDAVHSNLGMQHFFTGKDKKNKEGWAPACQESSKVTHPWYGAAAVDPFYSKSGYLLFKTNLSGDIASCWTWGKGNCKEGEPQRRLLGKVPRVCATPTIQV